MTSKTNRGGRPKGARNKLNATDEIKKALNRGTGLVELKQYLWKMMQDEKVSELQKAKFTQMYLDIMKFIHLENLKIEEPKQESSKQSLQKDIQKGENTQNSVSAGYASDKVYKIGFGKSN